MTLQELRALDAPALHKELQSLLRAQLTQRVQKATGQPLTTDGIRKTRREIARIRTLLTEKTKS